MKTFFTSSVEIAPGMNYRFGNSFRVDEQGVYQELVQRKLFLYNYNRTLEIQNTFRFIRFHFYGLSGYCVPTDWNSGPTFLTLTFVPEVDEQTILDIVINCLILAKLTIP